MTNEPVTNAGTTGGDEERRGRSARFWVLAGLILVAIIVAGVLIYQASMAAFQAQTQTGTSSFSTGSVTLTNDSEADSVFNLSGLAPGNTGSDTVTVTYNGTLDAEIRLYSETTGNTELADYIQLEITAPGAGGTNPWVGTLTQFQAVNSFANGILPLSMTGSADDQPVAYVVEYTVLDDAPMNATADVTFVWEAQSR